MAGEDTSSWLLVRGRGVRRLPAAVRADGIRTHSSTRRPAVQAGDRAVLYASGWQVVFGLVEVVSDPENDPSRSRWAWRFGLRPVFVLGDLREAPPVEAAGVLPRSLGRHSYIRLTDDQFDRFAEWQREVVGSTRLERIEELLRLLPGRPDVLELGVGAGVRSTRMLAERGRLTGVDVSTEQLERARRRLPDATLLHADLLELELPVASFDAVVAAYVLNHVPPEELGPLARRAADWLRPGGYLLATFGAQDNPGWTGEWLGVEMYFAGLPPEENRRLVEAAGLAVLRDDIEVSVEPGGEARFQWLLARRPE